MNKSIFIAFALVLGFVGTAWGQSIPSTLTVPFTASIENSPVIYNGEAKTINISANCNASITSVTKQGGGSVAGNTPVDAGTYEVQVSYTCPGHATGEDTYTHTGSALTLLYVIEPHEIGDATFVDNVVANDVAWTGSVIDLVTNPNYSLTVSSVNPLVYGADKDFTFYTVPSIVKDEGEYTIVFEGHGNYTGTVTRKFNVLKNVSAAETTTGIHFDIPTQLITTADYDFSAVVTDKKSHTTLYEGIDYELHFFASDTEANAYRDAADAAAESTALAAEKTEADIKAAGQGKYFVVAKGLAPRYTGKVTKEFYLVNEYQTYESTQYTNVALHITEPGYPVAADSPTGEIVPGEMQVGADGATAVATDAKRVFIPGTHTVSILPSGFEFNVVGIEKAAFDGCSVIRFIDARGIQNYIPSSLDRSSTGTPFKGLAKQTLVYLTGATVEGENYIYATGTSDLRCETFKIYDDVSGKQNGFGSEAAAKWDMEIPDGFTAYTIVNTRTLNATVSNKQQGYTVCLPYALPIPESFKAYTLSYSKTDQFGFTEVTTDELAAMTPYVLIPSVSGQPFGTTDAAVSATISYGTDWTYTPCTSVASAAYSGQTLYKLEGTMQYKTGTTDYYIMQANNVWDQCKATDYPSPCVLSMRAYMVANGTAASRLYSVFTNADGSTTAISNLQLDSDTQAEVYDLQGRKVSTPQRGGLYIVNGKKMMMK